MPQVYKSIRSYVSRIHDVLGRKKSKPRLIISEPFDFKKEDALSILPGIADEELYMLREKAAASIVGSAIAIRTYASTGDLVDLHDLHAPYDSCASSSLSSSASSSPITPSTSHGFHPHPHYPHQRPHNLYHHHSYTLRHKASTASCSTYDPSVSGTAALALSSHPTRRYSNATTASSVSVGGGGQHRIPRVAVGRSTTRITTGPVSDATPLTVVTTSILPPPSPSVVSASAVSASAVSHKMLARNNKPLPKPKSLSALPVVVLASTEPYAPSGLSVPPSLARASSMGSVREHARG